MEKPGVNIYTVAHQAGVSIATVSRVQRGVGQVAPATRVRVLEAIDSLHYKPNRLGKALAEQRHGATGIVFPDLSGPYYSEVILGYEHEKVAQGQSVLILGTHGRPQCDTLVLDLATRVDGLLILGRTVSDDTVLELEHRGVPVVLLARPPIGGAPAVRAENTASAIELTAHLLGHGHRRIAFVGDPDSSPDAAQRWEGFVEAHQRAGIQPPERAIKSRFEQAEGYNAAIETFDAPHRPTALMCANDEIALGAFSAARTRGIKVPDDLAVTGWDDIQMARFISPPLTTVRQPMRELGAHSASLLLARIRGESMPSRSNVFPTHLIVRGSCGCPPSPTRDHP